MDENDIKPNFDYFHQVTNSYGTSIHCSLLLDIVITKGMKILSINTDNISSLRINKKESITRHLWDFYDFKIKRKLIICVSSCLLK